VEETAFLTKQDTGKEKVRQKANVEEDPYEGI